LGKLPETFPNFTQMALSTGYIMLRSLLVTSVLVLYIANVSGDPLSSAHSKQCNSECRTDARKYFFAERIVKIWNSLPAEEANFCNIKVFIYLFI
jgi:hypothetical protein